MSIRTSLLNFPGQVMWRVPLRFRVANLLGPAYNLRCVLFHDIANQTSVFTKGLDITLSERIFEDKIRFLARYYSPVSIDEVLNRGSGRGLPRRAVLVTFDDAYASVAEVAGPICKKYGVPAVFFVNASLLGNQELGIDNLVCFVANSFGLDRVLQAARNATGDEHLEISSLRQFFCEFLPTLSLRAREEFRRKLVSASDIDTAALAREAKLYVTSGQLKSLVSSGFSVGNHTYSHVFCRVLSGDDFEQEIHANQRALEAVVGTRVRSFSVPYGSSKDLSEHLINHLRRSGHEALFLVESLANTHSTDFFHLNRVCVTSETDAQFFGELELQPRLRSIRNRLAGR